MIEHIVLIKYKNNIPETTIDDINIRINRLKDTIPEIISITAGRNVTDRSKGFQTGVVVRLLDLASVNKYRFHPSHVDVLDNHIRPHLEDIIVIDYEIGTNS